MISCLGEMERDRRREAVEEQEGVLAEEAEELVEWGEPDPGLVPRGIASVRAAVRRHLIRLGFPATV